MSLFSAIMRMPSKTRRIYGRRLVEAYVPFAVAIIIGWPRYMVGIPLYMILMVVNFIVFSIPTPISDWLHAKHNELKSALRTDIEKESTASSS